MQELLMLSYDLVFLWAMLGLIFFGVFAVAIVVLQEQRSRWFKELLLVWKTKGNPLSDKDKLILRIAQYHLGHRNVIKILSGAFDPPGE